MPRSRLVAVTMLVLLAAGVGAYLAYEQFLRGDNVGPLGLSSTSGSASATPTAVASSATTGQPATPADVAGTWSIGDGSVVGYRVREQLASLSAQSDAVGRTSDVTGQATLETATDGVRVTAAAFEADLTTLQSDDGRRDNRIREIGLESNTYPMATFTLTEPVDVPGTAADGTAVEVTLVGDLTIHGQTRSVEIPAQAQLNSDTIEIAGSFTFLFAEFGMTPPSIGGFVTVEDNATLEFLMQLRHD
jgi:polyisoprenoid-binding protein YceI